MIQVQLLLPLLFVMLTEESQCYPQRRTPPAKMLFKEEKQLQNGTIIGKYSYFDKEGGAVGVKYFADKEGYGVELKSLKISTMQPDQLRAFEKDEDISPISDLFKTFQSHDTEHDKEDALKGEMKKSKKAHKSEEKKSQVTTKSEKTHKTPVTEEAELDDDEFYDEEGSTERNEKNNCYTNNVEKDTDLYPERKQSPKKYHKEMYKAYNNRRNDRDFVSHTEEVYFCDKVK